MDSREFSLALVNGKCQSRRSRLLWDDPNILSNTLPLVNNGHGERGWHIRLMPYHYSIALLR